MRETIPHISASSRTGQIMVPDSEGVLLVLGDQLFEPRLLPSATHSSRMITLKMKRYGAKHSMRSY